MECSAPDCSKVAIVQWPRLLSTDENNGVEQTTREDREWAVEEKRIQSRRILTELEAARPFVSPNRIPHLERQLKQEQARLDSIVELPDPGLSLRPNTAAVFGCEDHAVDDPHLIHAAHCQAGACCASPSDPNGWRTQAEIMKANKCMACGRSLADAGAVTEFDLDGDAKGYTHAEHAEVWRKAYVAAAGVDASTPPG